MSTAIAFGVVVLVGIFVAAGLYLILFRGDE